MATKNTSPVPTRLIPAKRAAAELGVPYSTLRDAGFRGDLPVVRIGKNDRHSAWYFERRDLDNWIETRKERCG
jgi:hypothetical protein